MGGGCPGRVAQAGRLACPGSPSAEHLIRWVEHILRGEGLTCSGRGRGQAGKGWEPSAPSGGLAVTGRGRDGRRWMQRPCIAGLSWAEPWAAPDQTHTPYSGVTQPHRVREGKSLPITVSSWWGRLQLLTQPATCMPGHPGGGVPALGGAAQGRAFRVRTQGTTPSWGPRSPGIVTLGLCPHLHSPRDLALRSGTARAALWWQWQGGAPAENSALDSGGGGNAQVGSGQCQLGWRDGAQPGPVMGAGEQS